MLQKTRGVVLRTIKYSDNALIVDAYTELYGRASFVVRTARSKRSLVRSSLFQPLALVELEADFRPHTSLYKVREVKLISPFRSLPFQPVKCAVAFFLAEFLCRAVRDEAENLPLFVYLLRSIEWFDACENRFANFHLVFLMQLSRYLGLQPNLDSYEEGDCFDLLGGCFVSTPPHAHSYYLKPDEASRFRQLSRMSFVNMHLFTMNRDERMRCLQLICDYYRLHLPDFPELKSLSVLHDLFDV